jgi:hypothetical protein
MTVPPVPRPVPANDGQATEVAAISRIVLRPIGSSLPLGVLALVPAGAVMGVMQLGGIPVGETKTVAVLLLGFVVPLQFIASVLSFLARDTVAGTGLGLFGGTGVEHAGAILGLALAGTALYSALATEVEDVQGETKLPLARRAMASAAIVAPFDRQLERIEHEAGVRQQL